MKPLADAYADLALRSEILDAMADGSWHTAGSLADLLGHPSRLLSHMLIRLVRLEVLHRDVRAVPTRYRRARLETLKERKVSLKMLVGFEARYDEVRRHDCRHETQCVCDVAEAFPLSLWCECPETCEHFEEVPPHARVLASQPLGASLLDLLGSDDDETVTAATPEERLRASRRASQRRRRARLKEEQEC
jgi:hypothetical protein